MLGAVPWLPFEEVVVDRTRYATKIQRSAYLTTGSIPIVDQGQEFIAGHTDDTSVAYQGRLPVVLFGDHTRVFKYVDFPFAAGADGVKVLEPQGGLQARFLFYFLRSCRIPSGGYSRHFKHLKNLRIPVPDATMQRRIMDLLSRAENIVRMRREAEARAKEIIPALFLDMFGDPATNPKGWEVRTIGDVASYTRYGPRFPDRKYAETGAHILRTTDMDTNGTVRWDEAPVLPVTKDEAGRFSLKRGTIVITRTGATIGKVALFRGADRPCIAGAYLIELGTTDAVEPDFLLALLLSRYGQSALTSGSRAVAQPNLNAPTIRAIPVPIPPRLLQAEFTHRCAMARELCEQQRRAVAIAEETFQSVLAGVFGDTE